MPGRSGAERPAPSATAGALGSNPVAATVDRVDWRGELTGTTSGVDGSESVGTGREPPAAPERDELQPGFAKSTANKKTWRATTTPKIFIIFMGELFFGVTL